MATLKSTAAKKPTTTQPAAKKKAPATSKATAKAKTTKTETAKKPATTVKKPATTTSKPAAPAAKKPVTRAKAVPATAFGPTPEHRHKMIQDAAYFMAERNGFAGGAMDYWIAAEAQIEITLSGKSKK